MAVPVSGRPGLEVLASPTQVVLGRDKTVSLQVSVPPETGVLRVAASSGHFAEERLSHGAVRTFLWTPPSVRHPLVAVFLFWVEAAEGPPDVTVLRLALLGQTTLDVATSPGASVTVLVGETHFGPVQADGRGKARVPLEVPPGVDSARVLATRGELHTDASAPLDVPSVSPHVAALSPAPMPAQGGWLLVAGEGPLDVARLKLRIEGGRAEPTEVGDIARFQVTPDDDAASVTAVVQGDGGDVRAHAEIFRVLVTKPAVAVAPPAPVVDASWRPALQVLAGGVFARGDNSGPFGALGVAFTAPWWERRLAGEFEVGVRAASFQGTVGALGAVRSQVLAVPLLVSARVELLRGAALSLYGRAGGGVAPFRHRLQSDFPAEVKESKLSGMGFLAIQGAYRFGRWSALGELRGAWAPASTPWLDAQLGGVSALLGMRFEP
ncbi:hypothetical protein LXT21_23525 [Myxococcus sp. K38C18041901]|uniref:hypothetical protein n=1 Tax=Myxococcus guangdongensis TaxID=2906760 RepID=UPI0020A79915|nr:hypothetical protein [Myxococcus guangdongensis]MCP3061760.1 hypothetical protein [Myxococcus guangdongensis]